ncbi:MAG: hypothetical protein U1F52_16195 [Burkholderiales bacterium]
MDASDLIFVVLATVGCSVQLYESSHEVAPPAAEAATLSPSGQVMAASEWAEKPVPAWWDQAGRRLAGRMALIVRGGIRARQDEDPVP